MRIRSLHVKNFRSVKDSELTCSSLTALVGKNGSGKSTFLNALELFYEPSSKVDPADFYSEDLDQEIEIAITYDTLTAAEQEFFSKYVEGKSLTVARVFSYTSGKSSSTLHGMPLQNPDFAAARALGSASRVRAKYNELRKVPEYSSLPTVSSADNARNAMSEWEAAHPDMCERIRDDGQFFGYPGVSRGHLGRYTQFIRVPAVRDADDDATEKRGSAITELMNLVVRNALTSHPELVDLQEQVVTKFAEIMSDDELPQLRCLQDDLTSTLTSFVPDAAVTLQWEKVPELTFTDPQAEVRLDEDGYKSSVGRSGHGLQRAFIFTLLQHLSTARRAGAEADGSEEAADQQVPADNSVRTPNLVLAIEEPELYQHPSRQRHLASVLLELTESAGSETQVIYTTHSPLFVGLDRFDQIRVLRKARGMQEAPKVSQIRATTLESVATRLADSSDETASYTAESLRPRLQAVMTPTVNEGFFADVAVLVEGETDRAAILGTARTMNYDFDANGIAVIPCGGKTNIARPFVVFHNLQIPTYVIWDGDKHDDKDAKPEVNRLILRTLAREETDWPKHVDDESACFEKTLEHTLKDEIGLEIFNQVRERALQHFDLKAKQAKKNAFILQRVVEESAVQGAESETMKSIVAHIMKLKADT